MIPTTIAGREPIFLFGTLMDPDVMSAVIGWRVKDEDYIAARASGLRRVYVLGEIYPTLVDAAPTDEIWGKLFWPEAPDEISRLNAFEGDEYIAVRLNVIDGEGRKVTAFAYRTNGNVSTTDDEWHFENWRRRHKRAFLGEFSGWTRTQAFSNDEAG